jgi:hypothetical protein
LKKFSSRGCRVCATSMYCFVAVEVAIVLKMCRLRTLVG